MSAKRICIEKDRQTSDEGDKDSKVVINLLDHDSLAKIIMLLPIPERIDMEKVCTKWKEACQLAWYDVKKYKCESSIGRCYDNRLLTQSYLEQLLLRCGIYLRELLLSDVCDSSIMLFVGEHCRNLTSLECKFFADSLNCYAHDVVQAFTQLDKLKCIKITVDYNYLKVIINLSAIIDSLPEEINQIHLISKRWICPQKDVSMNFKKFKNLKKLTLRSCASLDSLTIQEIVEKITLVYLNIRVDDIPETIFLFNKLVNLEYIDLTPAFGTSGALMNNLSTKVLNTIFCTCKNLKHLDMPPGSYDIHKIPRKEWINFQNLEYLGITCNRMPDLANTIVEYCKNLKHLRIHHSYPRPIIINDTALKKLTELENLESLLLIPCMKLSQESIIAISNNCKKLKRLEIPYCTIVSSINGDQPLRSSSVLDELSKLQYLEHLNLLNLNYTLEGIDLEDSTIIAITNNCKNLKILQIRDCTAITETAFVALANLENLQKLEIDYLDITDDFIIKLKGLKELKCSNCQELTNAGIIQFIKNNPDLEKISVWGIDNITIDLVIAADQATKNRTNGIILQLTINNLLNRPIPTRPMIESQWLIVEYI